MTIRSATSQDILNISILESECFSDPWSEKELNSIFQNPFYTLKVIEDDFIVGYYSTMTVDDTELLRICVKASKRGKGYAKALMEDLISTCSKDKIFLEVKNTNIPAIALYEKFGFVKFGVRKNYYGGGVDALLYLYTKEGN